MPASVNFHLSKSKKFKSIIYSFKSVEQYQSNTYLMKLILANIIGEYSEKYKTKQSMTAIKDYLYGLNIVAHSKVVDKYEIFTVNCLFVDPKYSDINIDEYHNFIKEVMANIYFDEHIFNEIKLLTIDRVNRILENPTTLAYDKSLGYFEGDIFKKYRIIDIIEQLSTYSYEEFVSSFNSFIKECSFDLYVNGDIDIDKISELSAYLKIKQSITTDKTVPIKLNCINDICDEMAMSQSVIVMYFNTTYNKFHDDYIKWIVANAVFGKGPSSLLFGENREKYSLCYSVSAHEMIYEGVVRVVALIDADNYEQFKSLTLKQIERLKVGDVDSGDFDRSKNLLKQSLLSEDDQIQSNIDRRFNDYFFQNKLSIEEVLVKIDEVKIDDLKDIFNNYELCFTYLLKGVSDE